MAKVEALKNGELLITDEVMDGEITTTLMTRVPSMTGNLELFVTIKRAGKKKDVIGVMTLTPAQVKRLAARVLK